jgi:sec-independent protein translocase protein TatA
MFPQSVQTAGPLGLGGPELMVILGIAVLLFGGKKIPEVAKGIGEGIKNFKNAMKPDDEASADKDAKKEEAKREEVKK